MIDRQEVLRMYRESELNGKEIAEHFGCTPGRLIQIVKSETGMGPSAYRRLFGFIGGGHRARPVTPSQAAWILRMHGAGYFAKQISAVTKISQNLVLEVLADAGLRDHPRRFHGLPVREIARRYLAGETTLQLQDAYGVTERTIRRVLDAQGVPRRPRFSRPA